MSEQTMTGMVGSDNARSGWTPVSDRVDAPRPDADRSEAAQAVRPLPGSHRATDAQAEPESVAGTRDTAKEAAAVATFPTSYARFEINPDTQRLSIKIVDAQTNEVIREIPPDQVQRIADDLQSLGRHGTIGRRSAGGPGADCSSGGGVDRYV
jgi:uncharacterized FlaG/YvyC family protein